MPKKPRRHVTPFERAVNTIVKADKSSALLADFRRCEAPEGCPNIVNIEGRSAKDPTPVLCAIHR